MCLKLDVSSPLLWCLKLSMCLITLLNRELNKDFSRLSENSIDVSQLSQKKQSLHFCKVPEVVVAQTDAPVLQGESCAQTPACLWFSLQDQGLKCVNPFLEIKGDDNISTLFNIKFNIVCLSIFRKCRLLGWLK